MHVHLQRNVTGKLAAVGDERSKVVQGQDVEAAVALAGYAGELRPMRRMLRAERKLGFHFEGLKKLTVKRSEPV